MKSETKEKPPKKLVLAVALKRYDLPVGSVCTVVQEYPISKMISVRFIGRRGGPFLIRADHLAPVPKPVVPVEVKPDETAPKTPMARRRAKKKVDG